jgi:hypothetical protein
VSLRRVGRLAAPPTKPTRSVGVETRRTVFIPAYAAQRQDDSG